MDREHFINNQSIEYISPKINMDMDISKTLLIDLDNTIIQTQSGQSLPKHLNDFVFTKGIFSMLQEIVDLCNIETLIIVTNQLGADYQLGLPSEYLAKINFIAGQLMLGIDGLKEVAHWLGFNKNTAKPFKHNLFFKKDLVLIGDGSGNKDSYCDTDYRHALMNQISFIDINDPLEPNFNLFKGKPISELSNGSDKWTETDKWKFYSALTPYETLPTEGLIEGLREYVQMQMVIYKRLSSFKED